MFYFHSGWPDATACNYDSIAPQTMDLYNNDLGCGCDSPAAADGYDCNGNCLVDTDADVCDEFEIVGCQDPTGNYDLMLQIHHQMVISVHL